MIKKALLITLLTLSTAQADELPKVELVRVIDGDTVEVTYKTSVRLKYIDCYENKHNHRQKWQAKEYNLKEEEVVARGKESEQKLKDLLAGNEKDLYLDVKGLDQHKRLLSNLYIGKDKKIDVNKYMLKSGGCLPYKPEKRRKGAR